MFGLTVRFFCLGLLLAFQFSLAAFGAMAQESRDLTVQTVTRPPFSMVKEGEETGFSLDLLSEIADRLNWNLNIQRNDNFAAMLAAVEDENADVAAANISITASREATMDFSQPIFESGLSIMVSAEDVLEPNLMRALFSWDLVFAIGIAFLMLSAGGMLMWVFERKAQPYFDRPLKEAWFPSFWWALNLVVNGGFEERVPRSVFGRVFAVCLVLSSLFIVSVFVAKITAVMTVEAITGTVTGVNDLYGKRVGTISGSTAQGFLTRREIDVIAYRDLTGLINAFETGAIKIVVFDAPILDHYVNEGGYQFGRVIGSRFLAEYYGFLFADDSDFVEPLNRELLLMQEDGSYDQIYTKWFGARQ